MIAPELTRPAAHAQGHISGETPESGEAGGTGASPGTTSKTSENREPGDDSLVRSSLEGDQQAASALFRRYSLMVFNLALGILKNPEDARDACQDSFIKVFSRLATFRFESSFSTWLYRVALRTILKSKTREDETGLVRWKEGSGTAEDQTHWFVEDVPDLVNPSPHTLLLLEEMRFRCTLGMLFCLDRRHRAVFLLRVVALASFDEIAELMDTSPVNARQMFSRGGTRLLNFMKENCGVFNPACACHCHRTKMFVAWQKGEYIQADPIHEAVFSQDRLRVSQLVKDAQADLEDLGNRVAVLEFRSHLLIPPANPDSMLQVVLASPAWRRMAARQG